MDYTDVIANIKTISLTKDNVEGILKSCRNFWDGNYFETSEKTQNEVTILQSTLNDKKQVSRVDIETIFWILDSYGDQDTINEIIVNSVEKVNTVYIDEELDEIDSDGY